MDRLGIDTVLIPALKYGNVRHRGLEVDVPCEVVHELWKEYSDRFKGLAGINPHDGMEGVHRMERAIEDYGFVGITSTRTGSISRLTVGNSTRSTRNVRSSTCRL